MSYSSAPKPRPIGQSTPQQVLTALRQPSAIAVLASIAVHGALAVMLPLLPMQSEEPKRSRPVKVVALTPAEQGRLGLGTGNGFGNGNGNGLGNGLRSSNPLPDLSLLQPTYPLYSIPPVEPPVAPLDTPPVEQDSQSSTTSSSRTTPQTKPKPKPSEKPTTGGGGSGGPLAAVCPTPPDDSPACKKKAEDDKKKAEDAKKKELARLQNKYPPPTTKPTAAEVQETYTKSWQELDKVAEGLAGGETNLIKEPIQQNNSGLFPIEACPVITTVTRAQVGVIMRADGSVYNSVLMTSSGYKVLDDLALTTATSKAVKEFGKKSGKVRTVEYPFTFDPNFGENKCPQNSSAS